MPGKKVPEAQRRAQLLAAAFEVAGRDGLDAVTARRVAEAAGSSPGLVFFHFGSKDGLLLELLDNLLTAALDAEVTPEVAALPTAVQRLRRLVVIELEGLPEQRGAVELFFAYWFVLGRQPAYRERISTALESYADVFRPVCTDVVRELDARPGMTADALTTLVVSLIEGAAVQVVRDLEHFDLAAFVATFEAVVGR
jgi:AcrR family transcriptional regulator